MINLASRPQCTGCTACANICPHQCIQMKKDEAGFDFPEVIKATECIACGACERICPVLIKKEKTGTFEPNVYAAFTKDDSLRLHSSSGGIFSELANVVLEDGGSVYGASYDKNGIVRHVCVEEKEALEELQDSKYSQSILGESFQIIKGRLNAGEKILFSGTPCQVAGLKSFLGQDYENLICVDFVCHGVPSPMVWEKYIHYRVRLDNQEEYPNKINLRNKESGWSQYAYSVEFKYSDGSRYLCNNGADLYMRLFVGDYILRESCSECHFKGDGCVSDITLGDFWGIWDVAPEMDDNRGTSLILTHTLKGENLLKIISGNIKCKQVTMEQAAYKNQSMLKSSVHKENRSSVLKAIAENGFEAAIPFLQMGIPKRLTLREIIGIILRKLQMLK